VAAWQAIMARLTNDAANDQLSALLRCGDGARRHHLRRASGATGIAAAAARIGGANGSGARIAKALPGLTRDAGCICCNTRR